MNQPHWNPPLLGKWEKPLMQENYFPDRWKMLICCLMLNLTSHKQVYPLIDGFFEKWPNPNAAAEANPDEMSEYLKSLGMYNKRAKTIIKMSKQLLQGFGCIKQLYGCGQYAFNCDQMLYLGNWKKIQPKDSALKRYKNFLEEYYESNSKS